ncbi:MAG: sigma-70 family RNA polymerase sigma factor [Lachnospiraceae bacterium]|nr:sigma-70 family RNA polymerase sigma factor [Lachnospiraceae bacterium]
MNNEEYAKRIEEIRGRLYKTAFLYLGSESLAVDAVDEAVYKGLCNHRKLRKPEFFTTWMTRILINECHNEHRRQMRLSPLDELTELVTEDYDTLPLKEAIRRLPKELKDVIILRYFTGYTLAETAQALDIPQGTAATRQRKALQLLKLEFEEEVSS